MILLAFKRSNNVKISDLKMCPMCESKLKFMQPEMGQLSCTRVQYSRSFSITGVDFVGPIIIRSGIRRESGTKAWISLFVRFSTRAVHLEVVENLTIIAFTAALRRSMSRRGRCVKIFSDSGTNFVGAQKELSNYISKSIHIIAKKGIEWHLNPSSAPHFGGLWESSVKNTKYHLTRMMGETS